MSKWTLDTRLSMQVLLGTTGVRGEDLFSFQPIGRAKVRCFISFKLVGGEGGRMKVFSSVFPVS